MARGSTVNTDICGWSYTRFFDGGLQQESFADNNEDNNNNSNNGNNNSNENLNTSTSGGDDAPEWFKEHNIFSQVRRRRWVRLKCLANVREGCAAWLADRIRTLDVIIHFVMKLKKQYMKIKIFANCWLWRRCKFAFN